MDLYPSQIDPNSSGNGNGNGNTRTGKNVAVGIRSLLRKCAFGATKMTSPKNQNVNDSVLRTGVGS